MIFPFPAHTMPCFDIAEALLLGEGLAYSKHAGVISAFGQHFAKTGRVSMKFHRYLIDAEDSRHVGDYDIKSKLTKDDADTHIKHAEKFIELAGEILVAISGIQDTKKQ
jgi:uncharacterized protein (UPF0332 family)